MSSNEIGLLQQMYKTVTIWRIFLEEVDFVGGGRLPPIQHAFFVGCADSLALWFLSCDLYKIYKNFELTSNHKNHKKSITHQHQISSRNCDRVTPCGGDKYKWGIKISRFSTNKSQYLPWSGTVSPDSRIRFQFHLWSRRFHWNRNWNRFRIQQMDLGTVLCGGSRYRALSFIPEVGYIYCLWPQQPEPSSKLPYVTVCFTYIPKLNPVSASKHKPVSTNGSRSCRV